tara:strand:+ start:5042 stop:5227 length:186 start_codon:yes stop_codon:yes gene_type:complete
MSDNNMTEEQKREKIQEALESIDLVNLPPEITSLLEYFTRLTEDESFIENLNKEIVKKYGE